MAAENTQDEPRTPARDEARLARVASNEKDRAEQDSEDDDEEEEAEEEPKLKYSRLTSNLGPVYRNGDATSTFMVAGDKMIIGTHNGNIHALAIPAFQLLRTYNAHPSASITSISVSPLLASQPFVPAAPAATDQPETPARQTPSQHGHTSSPRTPRQAQVPAISSNQIYIGSSSIDGHVCVSSLVDPKEVTLRNYGRPVQAVALSPDYKNDRSYLSGGLAGELILTIGAPIGAKSNVNTSSASQTAQGWLGAIGLGGHGGKDIILHSGEGAVSAIKWSLSGKFVAWSNEHGIRIMRTNLHLDSADSEAAWKRIGFIDKPNRRAWQEMAGVWKARMEWVDDRSLESDDDAIMSMNGSHATGKTESTLPHHRIHQHAKGTGKKKIEKLVIGWGDAAWIVHVQPGGAGVSKDISERSVGKAEVIHFLRFDDCIVSGISLYTPSLLLVLAYRTRDDEDNPITGADTTPRRMHRRTNGLSPELKLIDAATSDEVEVDSLTVSRFESLSAADYHLGTLYVPHPKTMTPAQRSALEAIGGGIWDVGAGAARIFSTGASVMNIPFSSDTKTPSRAPSMSSASAGNASTPASSKRQLQIPPNAATAGLKVFIQSPYDCVLAIKRELSDHFQWELEHENYKDAWELIEDHPEIITSTSQLPSEASPASTPVKKQGSLQDFFADDSESQTTVSASRAAHDSAVEKEKRRIGDLWVQQLVNAGDWKQAGKVAGRVLGTSTRWEHWVWKFAQTNHFNEISPYMPPKPMQPPLPSMVYEVVLGHYIIYDRIRFKHLLEEWDPDLFDINSIVEAVKSKLSAGDVTEDSIEGEVQGRDWRILQDGLAKLFLASGRQREALRCYIRLQNADAAMTLIRDFHLVEAVRDDIPGFILMGVSKEQVKSAPLSELEEASEEAINVLVEEGCRGTIPASDVVSQLQKREASFKPFLHFYLRRLWKPEMHERKGTTAKERVAEDRLAADGKIVAEEFADLMVELFAEYDRPLLMEYLRQSQSYDLNKATAECERREYIPELVHILSKTGQTKRALYLIIEKLSDVSFAISFAKEQDDPDLWNDLLEYSMDKPHFIRGLLEEVGTAIDPIKLVRSIPEGLEIEGLRDGIGRMVREYEIQYSISEGVARVLRGEVAAGMDTLRAGQKRGVKFNIIPCDDEKHDHGKDDHIDIEPKSINPATAAKVTAQADNKTTAVSSTTNAPQVDPAPPENPEGEAPPGHCTGCHRPFTLPTTEEDDIVDGPMPISRDTLVGFACGHVFHLSCLLPKTSASASVATTLQQTLANDAAESGGWSRTVGAKVAHAHVIKSAVGRGCVVCRDREGMVGAE
ncbi:Nn.00g051350.m01.CDS01 [Neocucurbitaria sp. VM-36]